MEGFAPIEIAQLMNFSTLKNHSGNYITPLFEEKFEDVVWSVEVTWEGITQRVFLYILLEFQSKIDSTMPLRLMHYVACFYDHLLKTREAIQGMQQGVEQGMQQGEAAALKKLISLKFGELPRWAEAQIQSAGVPELEVWLDAILTSDTLESLLSRH